MIIITVCIKINIKKCFVAKIVIFKLMLHLLLFFLLINFHNKELMLYKIMLKNILRKCRLRRRRNVGRKMFLLFKRNGIRKIRRVLEINELGIILLRKEVSRALVLSRKFSIICHREKILKMIKVVSLTSFLKIINLQKKVRSSVKTLKARPHHSVV